MKRNRLPALLLAMLMTVALLAACNGESDSGSDSRSNVTVAPVATDEGGEFVAPSVEDLDWITFTKFVAGPGTPPGSGNAVVEQIENLTKTKLEFEFVVGDMDSRVGTMLASGLFPGRFGWRGFSAGGTAR